MPTSSSPDGKSTPRKKQPSTKQPATPAVAPDLAALCPEARRIYDDLADRCDITNAGHSIAELVAMTAYAAHLYYEAKRQIETTGLLVRGFRNPIVNPLIKVTQEQSEIYLKLLDKLKEEAETTNDPLEQLIKQIQSEVGNEKKQTPAKQR
jgi:AmiR/NasT family two-component response regulator